ncbi:MAG: DUF2608 domain-containing protein [Puniceicoccales bacterium]|jgi:hypothetical protein|nr:DUF2608 domain-containing protein [Puniceicoccales bacterium]
MGRVFSKLAAYVGLAVSMVFIQVGAETVKCESIGEVLGHVQRFGANKETLAVFDVNSVLIIPSDPLLHFPAYTEKQKAIYFQCFIESLANRGLFLRNSSEDTYYIYLAVWKLIKKSGTRCVNEGILSLNQNLCRKKIPTIFVSESFDGRTLSGNGVPEITKWLRKNLRKKGYQTYLPGDTKNGTVSYLEIPQEELPYENLMPCVVDEVVVSTNLAKKSVCVKAFLDGKKIKIQRILLIDDNKETLADFEKFCERENVDFLGIYYTEGLLSTYTLSNGKFRSAWMELFQNMPFPE